MNNSKNIDQFINRKKINKYKSKKFFIILKHIFL